MGEREASCKALWIKVLWNDDLLKLCLNTWHTICPAETHLFLRQILRLYVLIKVKISVIGHSRLKAEASTTATVTTPAATSRPDSFRELSSWLFCSLHEQLQTFRTVISHLDCFWIRHDLYRLCDSDRLDGLHPNIKGINNWLNVSGFPFKWPASGTVCFNIQYRLTLILFNSNFLNILCFIYFGHTWYPTQNKGHVLDLIYLNNVE